MGLSYLADIDSDWCALSEEQFVPTEKARQGRMTTSEGSWRELTERERKVEGHGRQIAADDGRKEDETHPIPVRSPGVVLEISDTSLKEQGGEIGGGKEEEERRGIHAGRGK
eukprot:3644547-Rhodomonas_salina.1